MGRGGWSFLVVGEVGACVSHGEVGAVLLAGSGALCVSVPIVSTEAAAAIVHPPLCVSGGQLAASIALDISLFLREASSV